LINIDQAEGNARDKIFAPTAKEYQGFGFTGVSSDGVLASPISG